MSLPKQESSDNVAEFKIENVTEDVQKSEECDVYLKRFWILGVYSACGFLDITIWGTFGPIMDSVEFAYGWSDGYVALLSGWVTITAVIMALPLSWVVNKYGLRIAMLIVGICMFVGTGLRCTTKDDTAFTYLCSVTAIVSSGVASCITFALPSKISSTWFPPEERTTATAIGFVAHRLGAIGMYLSPIIVHAPEYNTTYLEEIGSLSDNIEDMKDDIRILMFIHFGIAAILFACIIFAFPKAPLKPPSRSSGAERANFKDSLKNILSNKDTMLAILALAGCLALPFPWTTIMNFSLACLGFDQKESMWVAIAMCLACIFLTFIMARITDKLFGKMKITLTIILAITTVFYIWFALITFEVIETSSHVQVYISIIGAISIQYTAVPILSELIVEVSYPCPENILGSVQTMVLDVAASIFLLLLMIETECYKWISGIFVVGAVAVIIPVYLLKEEYKRSNAEGKSKNT